MGQNLNPALVGAIDLIAGSAGKSFFVMFLSHNP